MKLALIFAMVLSMAERPIKSDAELERYATISMAVETASAEQVKAGWGGTQEQLVRALLTAIDFESGKGWITVHSGENTKNGWCLAQVHHTNGHWQKLVKELRDLTGVGYEPTTNCMRVAARTLASGLVYARRNGYRRNKWKAMWTVYAGIPKSCRYNRKSKMWMCRGRHFSRQAGARSARMWTYRGRSLKGREVAALDAALRGRGPKDAGVVPKAPSESREAP